MSTPLPVEVALADPRIAAFDAVVSFIEQHDAAAEEPR